MTEKLWPAESLALTVGLAQVLRGEAPTEGVASICVLALARIDGRHDWTAKYEELARVTAADDTEKGGA